MENIQLIYKVLSGKASEAEMMALDRWIASDAQNEELFADLKELHEVDTDSGGVRDPEFYKGLEKIQDRVQSLKRQQKRMDICKTIGLSVVLSAGIFIGFLLYIGEVSFRDRSDNPSRLLLRDNLSFADVRLESILTLLEEKYGLHFDVRTDDLLLCRFTGTFYRGVSIEDMIRTLARSEEFEYTSVGSRAFELSGEGCAP